MGKQGKLKLIATYLYFSNKKIEKKLSSSFPLLITINYFNLFQFNKCMTQMHSTAQSAHNSTSEILKRSNKFKIEFIRKI